MNFKEAFQRDSYLAHIEISFENQCIKKVKLLQAKRENVNQFLSVLRRVILKMKHFPLQQISLFS